MRVSRLEKEGNMDEKKTETFTYLDLGFPIRLIDVPMRKIMGEWVFIGR